MGVKVSDSRDLRINSQNLRYDAVVLAVGHSARDMYQILLSHNMDLIPKDFAVSSYMNYYPLSSLRIYHAVHVLLPAIPIHLMIF